MQQLVRRWSDSTRFVAIEYLLLAAIVLVALILGGTNLAIALHLGSNAPAAGNVTDDTAPAH